MDQIRSQLHFDLNDSLLLVDDMLLPELPGPHNPPAKVTPEPQQQPAQGELCLKRHNTDMPPVLSHFIVSDRQRRVLTREEEVKELRKEVEEKR